MTMATISTLRDASHDVEITEDRQEYSGFRSLNTTTYLDPTNGETASRETLKTWPAVAVIAYDPALDELVMIRQFRLAMQLETGRGMAIEFVAGAIDDGETGEEAARREMMEEAGIEATMMQREFAYMPTPGITNEVITVFFAHVDATTVADRGGLEEETEETFPFRCKPDDVFARIGEEAFNNGITLTALLWLERNRERLLTRT